METKNILVPLDFSPCAKNALNIALELARKWGSTIHIVHATPIPSPVMGIGEVVVEPVLAGYDHEIDELFDDLEAEFPLLKKIEYTAKEYVSRVTDAIFTEMETKDIDLVVMGTKGKHDVLEQMLGGVTNDVIRFSELPVLIIPENVTELSIKKIALAVDMRSLKRVHHFDTVADLAKTYGAEIRIFNVENENETVDFNASEQRTFYDLYFEDIRYTFHHLKDENPTHGIFQFIDANDIDMLVMLPRHHTLFDRIFHGSDTSKVAMKLRIPMLTLHQ